MPGTPARDRAEGRIEGVRDLGGVFVEAVRATSLPMVLTDPTLPGDPIVFANQAFLDLSGYAMEDVLGQQPHFLNGPDTDPEDAARFRQILADDMDSAVETIQYASDGRRFVATVLLSAFKDDDGRTINHFLTWADVTRRVDAEGEAADLRAIQMALRQSEAKYRSLLDSIDQGFCVIEMLFDDAEQPVDYIFLETNPAFERQTGLTNAVGQRMRELAPQHEQHWFDIYGRVAATGQPVQFIEDAAALGRVFEVEAARVDGAEQHHVAILFRDITEARRTQGALRESEARYRTLFENVDEGYLLGEVLFDDNGDAVDIRFVEANPAAVRLAGRDFNGQRMREVDPNYESFWYAAYGRVALTGEPMRAEHYAAPHGRWFDFRLSRVGPAESRLVASVFQDITEAKAAEQALRENADRQEILLAHSDTVRLLVDAAAIQSATTQLVVERLGVDRAMYAEVTGERGAETGIIRGQSVRLAEAGKAAVAPFPDRFTFADYGDHRMAARYRGDLLIVSDIATDPEADTAERANWAAAGVRAAVVVPLVKDDRLVAEFGVHCVDPRAWTGAELALLREIAERTWAAIERARAEAALAASEEKYRTLFESIDEGVATVEVIFDEQGKAVDYRVLGTNPALTRLTGLRDIAGKLGSEIMGAEAAIWTEKYASVLRTGESIRFEDYSEQLDGWFEFYMSPVGEAGSRQVVQVYNNITARKDAEAALRESEERQAFLLKLSDTLRAESEPLRAGSAALRLLREHLGLDRSYIANIRGEDRPVDIVAEVGRPDLAPMPSQLQPADFPEGFRRAGEGVLVVDNIWEHRELTDKDRRSLDAIALTAFVVTPLHRGAEGMIWALVAGSTQPRHWAEGEIALLAEAAERIWTAIERAGAEMAMRDSEARLGAAFESAPVGLAVIDTSGAATLANAGYRLFLPRGVIPSRDPEALVVWQGWNAGGQPLDPLDFPGARALRGETVVPGQEMLFTDEAGRQIWTRVATVPIRDPGGRVTGAACVIHDIDDFKRSGEAWRESEERLRRIVASATDYAIFAIDPGGVITDWMPGAAAVFGWSAEEAIGQSFTMTFVPEDRAAQEPEKELAVAGSEGLAPNVRWHLRKDGRRVFIEGTATPLIDEGGILKGFLKIGQDVTERHAAEARQKLLLEELQHRVRNILGMIRSIARQSSDDYDDIDEYTAHLSGRLDALARTQVLLTRAAGAKVDLESLLRDELAAQIADHDRFQVEGPAVALAPRAAEVLGLALHELGTNSIKYGALAQPSGRIDIRWSVAPIGEESWLQLVWQEYCALETTDPIRRGFGTELIEQRVPYELAGEATLDVTSHGVRAEIAFPLVDGTSVLETGPDRSVDR
jgi:PAS domain S-box-containing protein